MRALIFRSESEVMEKAPKDTESGAQKRSKARAGRVMMEARPGRRERCKRGSERKALGSRAA